MAIYDSAADLARALARNAESVSRHYLSNGRREGRYWTVGDVRNTPGRSMFVRLSGPDSGPGAAGHWTDAASAEYGDLLDVIRESCGFIDFRDVADEARRFLSLPRPPPARTERPVLTPAGRIDAARRLFTMSMPIAGTLAEVYLRRRGIASLPGTTALRFHPGCYYRQPDGTTLTLPAMIAAVTDHDGGITGVHRTWLDPHGRGKATIATPRRAMGALLGNGVRFGFDGQPETERDVIAAGEGIETMLSLRMLMPPMPMIAALSAAHLGALFIPSGVRRLYIAADADGAGRDGTRRLGARAREAGIEALTLRSRLGDFNDDLRRAGADALRLHLMRELAPGDAARFLTSS
ncbi:MAG: toprim domain-containing protein [Bauldia sp.]|nr:toprim domain-containing protein [Bauldia sp.]